MNKKQEKTINKLIELNQAMMMAEMNHAKKTGIRHLPNKTYFKKLRKQKKLLNKTDEETLKLILQLLLKTTDALTRPEGLSEKALDTYSKREMIDHILSTRYLSEFLLEALENETSDLKT